MYENFLFIRATQHKLEQHSSLYKYIYESSKASSQASDLPQIARFPRPICLLAPQSIDHINPKLHPPPTTPHRNLMSEKKTGVAWDSCAEDLIIKFGVGVLGTGLAGAVLFRGSSMRIAAAAFGAGAGAGHSLSNCEGLLKLAKQDNRQKLSNSRS